MGRNKQNHIGVDCNRQFVENPQKYRGYSAQTTEICLKMNLNAMGFPGIERVVGVHQTTIINWVKQIGELLPDSSEPEQISQVGELDELEMRNTLARKHLNQIQVNE